MHIIHFNTIARYQQPNICLNTKNPISSIYQKSITLFFLTLITFQTFQHSSIFYHYHKSVYAYAQFNLCAKRLYGHQPC